MNPNQDEEATYPRNTESLFDMLGVWLNERPLPVYHAPRDETSDSIRVS